MLEQYIPIGLILTLAVIFGLVMAKASEWLGPRNPTDVKQSTYESGMEPIRTAHERISVKFYIVAMLFIIFDIEVVFLYPWAVNLRLLGINGLISIVVFVVVLMFGYLYVWRKGAFKWD